MKILLVDDDVFLRDMYATKFGEAGHKVDTAGSSAEALRKVESGGFDLMLLDMIMPGMSGIELMQAVNDQIPDTKMKYIVLSNQGQESDIADAKRAGALGYIVKAEMIPSDVVKRVDELMKK